MSTIKLDDYMEKAFLTPIILTKKQELLCEKYAVASRLIFNTALATWKDRNYAFLETKLMW